MEICRKTETTKKDSKRVAKSGKFEKSEKIAKAYFAIMLVGLKI